MVDRAYWYFSYLGLMTVWASFIMGFRYDPDAPTRNLLINILLYGVFIAIHILLTMPRIKQAVYGAKAGTPAERRIYVAVTIVTWLAVYSLQWKYLPVGGFGWTPPLWVSYFGLCILLLAIVGFFEFATFAGLAQLLGVHGSELSHTVGAETPLMTDGPYAEVRHPMYRAAFFATLGSLVMHPNAAQLLFGAMIAASFVGFIPFEEYQLLKARGDEYRAYIARTPYRVFRGLW